MYRINIVLLILVSFAAGCAKTSPGGNDPLYNYMMESHSEEFKARSLRGLNSSGF